jgi:prepilin-type N-terminal cleavage/methylation domain-containing protein
MAFFGINRTDMKNINKSGFTLVELSIVLIIIGLIVGGVVGGQSLIHSAKISKLISSVKDTQVSIRAFELQYDALPGDMLEATDYWPTSTAGNGDRKYVWQESAEVGEHLDFADILKKPPGGYWHEKNQLNDGNLQLMYYGLTPSSSLDSNYIIYGKPNNTGSGPHLFYSTISPIDAKAIDKKLDDGLSISGKVISRSGQDTHNLCDNSVWSAYNSNDAYILTETNETCFMGFKID